MGTDGNIIVLKRVEGEEEKKKGGVWKIAHADFMTAMMAFFLIMWLVNATDEEMRKSIANYFNPINLMASPTDRRGLMNPDDKATPPLAIEDEGQTVPSRPAGTMGNSRAGEAAGGGNVEDGNENRMDSAGILTETDGAEFHDPYAVMASSASDLAPEDPVAVDVPQTTQGAPGTTSLTDSPRDPFDPAYWQTVSPRPARSIRPGPTDTADEPSSEATIDAADRRPTEPPETARAASTTEDRPSAEIAEPKRIAASEADDVGDAGPLSGVGPRSAIAEAVLSAFSGDEPTGAGPAEPAAPERNTIEAIAENVRDALEGVAAGVDVRVETRGGEKTLLVSLTDGEDFSMFAIGSAEPSDEASGLFSRVAAALSALDGRIVIRGHTDARPFRGGDRDNWTLSFARAHAAKEELVASGVSEQRIARVEGLADREPTVPEDPLADENRRIEILYEPVGEAP